MQFKRIDNFRFTDRNKAGGDAVFDCEGVERKAEFVFYLQGIYCLSIKLGRHDKAMVTSELEEYIRKNMTELKKMVNPDVERIRKERRAILYGESEGE
ncbi:MAG: hypothetical protein PHC92_10090 [Syntrophomonadaceae bacterium]|nr:hypothetical protein [Syntrophomonadaceae bacterium]MDD3024282.1 hypothetical protein [Syntrophomonadaceae bacterium]